MSLLTDLIARIRAAVAELPTRPVGQARELIAAELAPELARLCTGTSDDELAFAAGRLASLVADLDHVLLLLTTATGETENWINEQVGTGTAPPAPHPSSASATQSRPVPARVAEYRARLEHPWPYGRPLRGWRLAASGQPQDRELTSGTKLPTGEIDPAYTAAVDKARTLGLARGGFVPDLARHIEIKEAATMCEGETRVIVIGKDPCGIDPVSNVSCHRFLRYFLPANATLIVYGPVGQPFRYEGKRTS